MSLPKGIIDVRILADGTVRVETGDMGGVAHKSADDFIKELQRTLGGAVVILKAEKGHHHQHDHDHTDHHHHN